MLSRYFESNHELKALILSTRISPMQMEEVTTRGYESKNTRRTRKTLLSQGCS